MMMKKQSMKKFAVAATMAVSMLAFSGIASAHVTVQPTQVQAGTYQVLAVRVPSEEKDINTVKIKVNVPAEINVSRVEPKPGWKYEVERSADDVITSITWTAEGSGLSATEFTEFRVSGKVADDATQLVWKAYQTYSDGQVVEWVGGDGADKPASVTTVTPAAEGGDAHGDSHDAASTTAAESDDSSDSKTPLILSIVAVVLGAASLLVSLTRKKR
ncbi:uncharacterized protein YcnI [Paenibacillus cellulosilyticus]|uniref:Uncharacterized protein YcnI n=1 Tax=Paenibacillus cellulosilyticus TaxID=375489 RepID=A0A2V2Z7U0_9BACL|nr:uncharacterized protein YcnI [Paenibacillus cellulosilyticus]